MKRLTIARFASLAACGGEEPAKAAAERKDWTAFLACTDPEGVDLALFSMTLAAGFAAMQDKEAEAGLKELQKRHGVREGGGAPLDLRDNRRPHGLRREAREGEADVRRRACRREGDRGHGAGDGDLRRQVAAGLLCAAGRSLVHRPSLIHPRAGPPGLEVLNPAAPKSSNRRTSEDS
jgi:hypothetical protein